jgi:hypothetical protein
MVNSIAQLPYRLSYRNPGGQWPFSYSGRFSPEEGVTRLGWAPVPVWKLCRRKGDLTSDVNGTPVIQPSPSGRNVWFIVILLYSFVYCSFLNILLVGSNSILQCDAMDCGRSLLKLQRGLFPSQKTAIAITTTVKTAQKTHCVFITKTNRLMLFRKIIHCPLWEPYDTHKYTVWEKCTVFLS